MKKTKILLVIISLIFQACGSENGSQENIDPLTKVNDDLQVNNPPPENNNPPPENNNPPPENNNPPPENNNPPPENNNPPPGGNDIDRAVQIIKDADDSILNCVSKALPTDIYQNIIDNLNPDNFEAGIIIDCFNDPTISNNVAQQPPGDEKNNDQDSPNSSANENDYTNDQNGNMGNSWYDLNIYDYNPSYTVASENGKSGFGLNESAEILLSGYGFNNPGGSTKLNHPVSISANAGKLALTDRFNNRVLIY